MLTASPSPRLETNAYAGSGSSSSPHSRYNHIGRQSLGSSPIVKPHSSHVDYPAQLNHAALQWSHETQSGSNPSASVPSPHTSRRKMVDAGTQYSPPPGYSCSPPPRRIVPSQIVQTDPADHEPQPSFHDTAMPTAATAVAQQSFQEPIENNTSPVNKRQNSYAAETKALKTDDVILQPQSSEDQGPSKRARGDTPPVKMMPLQYELCDTRELVILISSMLMELIRYNDAIPLRDGALTRFHSRAPPGISVADYLQRLTTHATLSPPILLSMVYYIDKLCALYPAFTISSLTVHRFLITSATVASKGLSDSFWTNKTYARVGGVSIKELATLELEFLGRVQWRIVPKPEVLIDYYRSLVERSPGYELETKANVEAP